MTAEEAFPTLPGSKSVFVQKQIQQEYSIPKPVETIKPKSIFIEESKFEMAKPKADEVIIKKGGKKGKGKP